jgi:hypothetical protein
MREWIMATVAVVTSISFGAPTKHASSKGSCPVCYPFHDFIDAINNQTGQPNIGNSTWLDLPKLNNPTNDADPDTAYFKLGKQAGRFLAGTANVQLVTWDGTQWGPPS